MHNYLQFDLIQVNRVQNETATLYLYFHPTMKSINKFGINIKDLDVDTSKPVCNTLFVALMPTASSSNLLSCTEGFEVPQSMIYVRKLDKGEFVVVQDTLVKELKSIGFEFDFSKI